ncbi:MAG: alpha/beta fold hydrolase [Planctomycetes bacterium]|nr:alpha/beta fold hydrolase [Planctomycetota bacterium]
MTGRDDWRALYPFAPHYLAIDGARMHYVDEGNGSPILMVHGNPTWSFYYRELILRFRDRYRCVAPDHMGCGLSDKPAYHRYCMEQRVDELLVLIETLDLENITLVVHDWGGAIGLFAALREPHRFARFVLFNTGAFPPMRVPWRILACRIPWLGTLLIRGANGFARAALRMATERPERLSGPVAAGLLAPYDSWRNRVAIDRFVKDIPLTARHPTMLGLAILERGLPFFAPRPVRMIWGARDWCFTLKCAHRLRDLLPHAELFALENAGHYVVEDATDEVLRLVEEFLEGEGAPRAAGSGR